MSRFYLKHSIHLPTSPQAVNRTSTTQEAKKEKEDSSMLRVASTIELLSSAKEGILCISMMVRRLSYFDRDVLSVLKVNTDIDDY